jgi:hypothetical protein
MKKGIIEKKRKNLPGRFGEDERHTWSFDGFLSTKKRKRIKYLANPRSKSRNI